MKVKSKNTELTFDAGLCAVTSLKNNGVEYISENVPAFEISMLDMDGNRYRFTSRDAKKITETQNGAVYSGFPVDISVSISIGNVFPVNFGIQVENGTEMLCEWVDYPRLGLKKLKANGGEGEVLFPYNEGVIIDDIQKKQTSDSAFFEPVYPSFARYFVFPNMLSSQFCCYLQNGEGLYIGFHDAKRGVKQIDIIPSENGIINVARSFCGGDFGKGYKRGFDTVLAFFDGDWYDGAQIYREWFEENLPTGVIKTCENEDLPEWYADSPLIVTYPVRGIHDMDKMEPNALFPYENALPYLDEISEKTGCRVMSLLMHWEGTAPWAPPYVWPPYGGEKLFCDFRDRLHERGHLLGVYCSGFGYTYQSNLLPFNLKEEFEREGLIDAMTAGPDGKVTLCRTCTGQRSGYDICVANKKAKDLLSRAYYPLFEHGIDYAQILDQNHGGGQYFCYGRNHDHAPCPGDWMTSKMQDLLGEWNHVAGKMLLGCESAAAEAFIGNLRFSDNRYELNWAYGTPVPLYAYIYHEYLRNFMGNQCCCELDSSIDTMRLRLAYSFTAGDAMTLVLTPDGQLMCNWGTRDFEHHPDKELTLEFIANMQNFAKNCANEYLIDGKMIKPEKYSCKIGSYRTTRGTQTEIPDVFSTAWEKNGKKVQIFVNHTNSPAEVVFRGEKLLIDALSGVLTEL